MSPLSNFTALSQTMYEKSITIFFTSFSILRPQGDTLGQSPSVSALTYSKGRSITLPNFLPF